ncbi:hypothetical protein [Bifidobacterium biavatii]|uniref:Protein kinase n=1 Tax=Bifidobacterium biavatii DSM 23969 TaxID=1437608 RepID=A0A086ZHV6_9BIFI|nr:hypothetical protein [Bifidobacterium biavatii]KFI46106.1 protein kinase [Bifidobacterium biavatii DSM 23969]
MTERRMLMCREFPVMTFEFFPYGGYALYPTEIIDQKRLPLGMYVNGRPEPDGESITAWWRSRGIPATRDGLRSAIGTGMRPPADLLDRSLGLSLSDQYWVRPVDRDDLKWEDLNFFHHDFDERIGRALFTGGSSQVGDVNTPDITSAGDLPKRWIIQPDGTRTLIKGGRTGQEPDNERIAGLVCDLFGMDHVDYHVGILQDRRVCACNEMLTDREELIPGGQIMKIFRNGTPREGRAIWEDACERLGVPRAASRRATDDFLFLDFLLRNTDRHYNNFGIIRDVETLRARPAPIFDTGMCLWNGLDPVVISNDDYAAKPFRLDDGGDRPNAYWQLSLIREWDHYDLGLLDSVPDIVHDQLALNRRIPSDIVSLICSTLRKRAELIRKARDRSVIPSPSARRGMDEFRSLLDSRTRDLESSAGPAMNAARRHGGR